MHNLVIWSPNPKRLLAFWSQDIWPSCTGFSRHFLDTKTLTHPQEQRPTVAFQACAHLTLQQSRVSLVRSSHVPHKVKPLIRRAYYCEDYASLVYRENHDYFGSHLLKTHQFDNVYPSLESFRPCNLMTFVKSPLSGWHASPLVVMRMLNIHVWVRNSSLGSWHFWWLTV